MYYSIIDLTNGNRYNFDTKEGLLFRWRELTKGTYDYFYRKPRKVTFNELNVTGRDITWEYVSIPAAYDDAGGLLTERRHEYVRRLRRYQVVDQDGRGCDIRAWGKEIAKVESTVENPWRPGRPKWNAPRFRIDPVWVGHKRHYRCASTPSSRYKQYLMERKPGSYEPDEEYPDLMPILDHSRPRGRGLEYRGWKSSDFRSWKRMNKCGAQWAKHKEGRSKNVLRRGEGPGTEDHEPLCECNDLLDAVDAFGETSLAEAV